MKPGAGAVSPNGVESTNMKTRSVRIRAVFRPDDPDAVNVLRLAAVANDLDSLGRVLIEKKEDEATESETSGRSSDTLPRIECT